MKVLIIAGEASGDLHGSHLIESLLKKDPSINFFGVGGEKMETAGVKLYFDIKKTAIIGAVEIFSKIFFFKKLYSFLLQKISENIFDAVILIDYPTLNLRLARASRKKNIPVFYFISPQVWAWNKKRIKQIKRDVTKMMVILPFEKGFYQKNGLSVDFVGHPFVDIVKPTMTRIEALHKFALNKDKKTIALFPGSRNNEIKSLLPVMLKAGELIQSQKNDIQFLLCLSETVNQELVSNILSQTSLDIKTVFKANYDSMMVSDFLIAASGSVTLEASFFAVPMVIIYKANPITLMLARLLVSVKHIGLVNIVGKETIAPEFIQSDATPKNIATETLDILNDQKRCRYIKTRLHEVRKSLGEGGACENAANIIFDTLKKKITLNHETIFV